MDEQVADVHAGPCRLDFQNGSAHLLQCALNPAHRVKVDRGHYRGEMLSLLEHGWLEGAARRTAQGIKDAQEKKITAATIDAAITVLKGTE